MRFKEILYEMNQNTNISFFDDDYQSYVKSYLNDLYDWTKKKYDEGKSKEKPDPDEYKKEEKTIIGGTIKNSQEIIKTINTAIQKFGPKWKNSHVIIEPLYNERDRQNFSFKPATDFSIGIGNKNINFSLFSMGEKIDDILDAGDKDFFHDASTESDYFLLADYFQNPNKDENKAIILYTARPKKDKHLFNNVSEIPTNIFLTTSFDEAAGYAHDFGDRDIYKLKIRLKYLITTLDNGRIQNYQTIGDGKVPIVGIQCLT